MLAEDIAPSRLQKAQQLVSQILNSLASDRVGLIAYAGSAVPQLPITTDYSSARMFLQGLDTELVSSQGTAIAEAIQLAQSYYAEESEASKVLIIISDGEDHEGKAMDMAEDAAEAGVKIITIGVGTAKGGPIPIKQNGITRNYKKNNQGETVITRLDTETLSDIAEVGNGIYIDGTVTDQVIDALRDKLETIDKAEFESQEYADFESQYQWFLAFAIFFFVLDIFYLERRTGWIKRLNLFNE
jgi:Ca-activated chloride channel family protein